MKDCKYAGFVYRFLKNEDIMIMDNEHILHAGFIKRTSSIGMYDSKSIDEGWKRKRIA